MDLRIKIKPTRTIARLLESAIDKSPISRALFTISSEFGTGYMTVGPKSTAIYVYTCQKHRPKRGADGIKKTGYWEVHTYRIPIEVLKATGLKVKQGRRTFEFVTETK